VGLLPDLMRRGIGARIARAVLAVQSDYRHLPTSSIYFTEPLADLIGRRIGGEARPIRRLAPTVFACGATAVVLRYARPRQIALLEQGAFERIYLVIDDDFAALNERDGLPADYRQRLLHYRDGALRRLMTIVTHVVAPSELILANYPDKVRIRLDPAQCHQSGGLDHHGNGRTLDVVFAGTRSHLQDLTHVADAIADVLRLRPDMRLTTFLNGHAPKALKNLDNAIHLSALEWPDYRAFVAANRYHVAIAPAMNTAFNAARSVNKLHDHAAFGAAGLYSRQSPFDRIVDDGRSGLLLPNEPARWREALLDLVGRRDRVRQLAAEGQNLSRRLGDRRRVRAFWFEELGLS
jgi:hypothetical protein